MFDASSELFSQNFDSNFFPKAKAQSSAENFNMLFMGQPVQKDTDMGYAYSCAYL
jgi:hypothetical protein